MLFFYRYGEYLPLALKDLSFETKGREKVGIVGRTGSGKSSIFQVLFRTADLVNGEVTIDGVNINLLNLAELRSILTIIPQKPFLFKGSVKENVDPLGKRKNQFHELFSRQIINFMIYFDQIQVNIRIYKFGMFCESPILYL